MLVKLSNKIIDNPKEEKFRKINCNNNKLKTKFFSCAKIKDLLQYIGFKYDPAEEMFIYLLDNELPLFTLQKPVRDEIASLKEKFLPPEK